MSQKLFSIPLIFLFIASCIGLMLRFHFVQPISWLSYTHWLHAHSHLMFLGWVFNAITLAFLYNYNLFTKRYQILFGIIQFLLVAMLISFPIQGYGIASITISTLHTFSIYLLCFWMFRDLKKQKATLSIWFAKISLALFIISSLGPFAVGFIKASGLGNTFWYHDAVYYYLHFQYNGVFVFGIISLFIKLLEEREIKFDTKRVKTAGRYLFYSSFLSYFLSTLWSAPGILFNIIGFSGALLQLVAVYLFFRSIPLSITFRNSIVKSLLLISFISFILKCFLQLISAHPKVAVLAFEVRPFVIAYLHLVLIGVFTFFIMAWYVEKKLMRNGITIGCILMVLGFIGTELAIVASGIIFTNVKIPSLLMPLTLFCLSIILFMAFGVFLFRALSPSQQ